jgi:hypothetical protein
MAIGYSFYFYFWIRLRIFWIPAFLYFSAIPASPLFSFSCFSVFLLHIYIIIIYIYICKIIYIYIYNNDIEHVLLELSPSIHWRQQVLEEASWQVKP